MKKSFRFTFIGGTVATVLLPLSLATSGWSQTAPADKAQALLEEAKARDLDRQRNAKVRELERLNEDLEKDKKEAADLQQAVEQVNAAVTDSTNRVAQLNTQKKQFAKMVEVTGLQIEAEELKVEGLKMLSDAQAKAVVALTKRAEETEVRRSIEKAKLTPPPPGTTAEASRREMDVDRRIDRAERASATARSEARTAMTAATAKLQAASTANDKVKARAAELGVPIRDQPSPIQENVEPLQEVDPTGDNAGAPSEVEPEAAAPSPTPAKAESKPAASPTPQEEEKYPRAMPVHPQKLPRTAPTPTATPSR